MRIAYLHQYFNTPDMSGGTRSYEMARRMVAAGHSVVMITSWRNSENRSPDWFVTNEAGIEVHWFPVPYSNSMSYGQRVGAFTRFAVKAVRKVLELDVDVIFATSTPLTIAVPAIFAAKRKRIPMVFEVRDLWPELPIAMGALRNPITIWLAKCLENWAYRNSEAIIALSKGMKDGVVRTGYPAERVAVIPNSSDNKEFSHDRAGAIQFRNEREWLKNRPLLVYAGTFGRINGVGYMVELAKELHKINPEIRILLVGDGQEKQKICEQAKLAGVWEVNFFIENTLPKKQIPALLSAADMAASLFIDLPEMQPNSANKFFDALASGTPILINYGGWQHELIKAYQCGLAMWRNPIEEVAEEISKKIQDAHWLAKAGGSARMLAEKEFDRDKLALRFYKVLAAGAARDGVRAEEIAPGPDYV